MGELRPFADIATGETDNVYVLDGADKSLKNTTDEPITYRDTLQPGESIAKKTKKQRKFKMPWEYAMINVKELYMYIFQLGLSDREILMMTYLSVLINYDCKVCNVDDGQYMTTSEVAKLCRWSKSKTIDVLKQLELKDVLVRFPYHRSKCVMLNPSLYYRGKSNDYNDVLNTYSQYRSGNNKANN